MSPDPILQEVRKRPKGPSLRIVAIVVIVVIVLFAAVAGFYHGNITGNNSPLTSASKTCTNGATDYPHCHNNQCTNGATNYPRCNNNPCPNGALNPPACTIYNTQTSLTCNPSTVHVNRTKSDCIVAVTDTTVPTGTVSASCTPRPGHTTGDCTPTSCTLAAASTTSSSCQFSLNATGPGATMDVCANYPGDSTHQKSSNCFTLAVLQPPASVTVSGTATVNGLFATPTEIHFVSTLTGQTYRSLVKSGSYTLSLPNFQNYNVTISYDDTLTGSGSCTAGTLTLHSYDDAVQVNYRC